MFRSILVVLGLYVFLTGSLAFAGSSSESAKLQQTIEEALDVMFSDRYKDLSIEAKQTKVRDVIEARYDLNVIIRRSIGRNWGLMNEVEQVEVLELVKRLVVKAYVKGIDGIGRPVVEIGKVVEVSPKRIEIPTTVVVDGKKFAVLYRFGHLESGWQIYDIVAENISIVSNYRQQIDDHFRKGNAQGLINKLEELLTREDLDEDIKL